MNKAVMRFRLLQLSPLIVAAIMTAAWFSLPTDARQEGLGPLYVLGTSPDSWQVLSMQQVQVSVMEAILRHEQGLEPFADLSSAAGEGRADALARRTSTALAKIEPEVCDDNGVPRALTVAEQEEAFADVAAFEDEFDASVAVLVISSDPAPPVALSSIGDESILTDEERAAIEDGGTVEELRRLAHKRLTGPLWVDLTSLSSGISGDIVRDGRTIGWSTLLMDGRYWESYAITPEGASGQYLPYGMWQSLSDPALKRSADAIAQSTDGAVLVVGPVDSGRHVVRPATGMSAEESAALWGLFDTKWQYEAMWAPIPLDRASRATAGGAGLAELALAGSGATPRVALIALYDMHPRVPALWNELGRSPLMVLQVWLATYLSVVLVVLGLALATSFVASPLAFRAERLYREQLEVERERARVQREAELRVVRKLDELSTRVESVQERASDATAAGVAGVAEDIDSTVAELRAILGDVVGKGDPDE